MSEEERNRDELMQALGGEIRAAQRATEDFDDLVARRLGVNRTDARALDVLDQYGRMTAGELSAATQLTSGAITGVIDRLERAGYVQRTRDPTDRRRVWVELTELTRTRVAEHYGPLAHEGMQALQTYDDEQLALFLGILRRSRELTEKHAARLRGAAP